MEGLPLYVQVRNSIKEGIERGIIVPDANGILPGQQELAENYNVGICTIKRVIRELTQMGLVESRQGKGLVLKGHQPAQISKVQDAGRICHVGVTFVDTRSTNPFHARIMNGIDSFSRLHNIMLHMLSFPGMGSETTEEILFGGLPLAGLDGILLFSPGTSSIIARLKEHGIPYVSYGLLTDDDAVCHVENMAVKWFDITSALLKHDVRDMVLFAGREENINTHLCLSGYRNALKAHGLNLNPDYVAFDGCDVERCIQFLQKFITGYPVGAVLSPDDIVAAEIAGYLRSVGRSDIFIAGSGNLPEYTDRVDVTLEVPYEEIGYNSIESLFKMINGIPLEKKKYFYDYKLIERERLTTRSPETVRSRPVEKDTIAIYVNEDCLASPTGYYRTMVDKTRRCIEHAGYRAVLVEEHGNSVDEILFMTHMFNDLNVKSLAGMINVQSLTSALDVHLAQYEVPSVAIGGGTLPRGCAVIPDNFAMLKMAQTLFESYGYEDFAFMCSVQEKNAPAKYIMQRHGLPESMVCDENLIQVIDFSMQGACDMFSQWWKLPNRPNAILFSDHILCAGAARAFSDLGINIPDDLGIITHSNSGETVQLPKDLTRLEFDTSEIVDEAWKMLEGLILKQPDVEHIKFILPHLKEAKSLTLQTRKGARTLPKRDTSRAREGLFE